MAVSNATIESRAESISPRRERALEAALTLALALAPLEARHPALASGGLHFTLLEVVAASAVLVVSALRAPALLATVRRPSLALGALWMYAAVNLLSASVSPDGGADSFRFALRMASAALWATVVASTPVRARRAGLRGVAAGALVVAVLVLAEAAALPGIDRWLEPFRESAFVVGGTRRPTGPTEYPNLAAFFLAVGMASVASVARPRAAFALGAVMSGALVATYSRAGLAVAAAGLVALIAARPGDHVARRAATAILSTLAVAASIFTVVPTFRLRVSGEPTEAWYRARYAPTQPALILAPGEHRRLVVAFTNAGSETWRGDGSLLLGHHWYTREGQPVRLERIGPALRNDVPPGGSAALEAPVEAPLAEGDYVLAWDLIHVHAGWFTHRGIDPGTTAVRVSVRPDVPEPNPSEVLPHLPVTPAPAWALWRPDRKELWSLAAAMWRDHPWLGAGPDTFRRFYGRQAGRARWDTRIYANNALLEAAATTGLAGAGALAVVYGAMLWSAWRRRSTAMPGALGLAVALVVHAFVDYVLAFTGAYLVFGFAVGASSSSHRTTSADG